MLEVVADSAGVGPGVSVSCLLLGVQQASALTLQGGLAGHLMLIFFFRHLNLVLTCWNMLQDATSMSMSNARGIGVAVPQLINSFTNSM